MFGFRKGVRLSDLNWTVVLGIGGIHILAVVGLLFMILSLCGIGPWHFTWTDFLSGLAIFIFFFWLTGWIGITLCYHRLLTHWSFKTPDWFMYVLIVIGTLTLQGSPARWVAIHRKHHRHSDTEHDPHSNEAHGFNWAHVLWLFFDNEDDKNIAEEIPDLRKSKGIMFIDRFCWVPPIALTFVLFGLGYLISGTHLGMAWVFWGVVIRTAVVYHVTWFVNSAAHTWGYVTFETGEGSKNNWWVAILSGGEGWHNNHHAYQGSAAHGMRWWEIDPTYWTIEFLGLIGLAKKIVRPKQDWLTGPKAINKAA